MHYSKLNAIFKAVEFVSLCETSLNQLTESSTFIRLTTISIHTNQVEAYTQNTHINKVVCIMHTHMDIGICWFCGYSIYFDMYGGRTSVVKSRLSPDYVCHVATCPLSIIWLGNEIHCAKIHIFRYFDCHAATHSTIHSAQLSENAITAAESCRAVPSHVPCAPNAFALFVV